MILATKVVSFGHEAGGKLSNPALSVRRSLELRSQIRSGRFAPKVRHGLHKDEPAPKTGLWTVLLQMDARHPLIARV